MIDWQERHKRHRRFQIALTLGVTIGAVMTIVVPHLAEHAAYVATLTSLAWIWEQ